MNPFTFAMCLALGWYLFLSHRFDFGRNAETKPQVTYPFNEGDMVQVPPFEYPWNLPEDADCPTVGKVSWTQVDDFGVRTYFVVFPFDYLRKSECKRAGLYVAEQLKKI